MKSFFNEYLSFTKQDRNAIAVLVVIIFMIAAIKFFAIPFLKHHPSQSEIKKQDSIASLFASQIKYSKANYRDNTHEIDKSESDFAIPQTSLTIIKINHNFNPNEFQFKDWLEVGFPEKFSKTISNYLAKGWKFRKPEDLKKVYGMKDEWYEKIEPFIVIPSTKAESNYVNSTTYTKPKLSIVELNVADSATLEALPMIGGKTAIKIIKYRNLIGGFVSLNQLKEVWGFKDSMLLVNEKRITIDVSKISKLNINSATIDQLKRHPYIKFNKAKLLVAYREQHGKYQNIEELKKVRVLTEDDITKISPYLIFE